MCECVSVWTVKRNVALDNLETKHLTNTWQTAHFYYTYSCTFQQKPAVALHLTFSLSLRELADELAEVGKQEETTPDGEPAKIEETAKADENTPTQDVSQPETPQQEDTSQPIVALVVEGTQLPTEEDPNSEYEGLLTRAKQQVDH